VKKISSLSIFFPCYNDAGTIASMVILAEKTAKKISQDYEIIVINDASQDASQEVLKSLKTKVKNLKIITHQKNKGYGGTLKSGFKNSKKEWIFYTDGDFQYNIQELESFAQAVDEKTQLIQGYKIKRHDPWYRIVIGNLYNFLIRLLFRLPYRDIDCDFRLIKKQVFKKIKLESNTGAICVEMMLKFKQNNISYKEIPVNHYVRQYQLSQFFNFRRIFKTIIALLRIHYQYVWKKRNK
jgi:glycosyltransferase involved in cell wall biosynthesis